MKEDFKNKECKLTIYVGSGNIREIKFNSFSEALEYMKKEYGEKVKIDYDGSGDYKFLGMSIKNSCGTPFKIEIYESI